MVSLLQKAMCTNPSLVEQTLEKRPNHIGAAVVTISEAMMVSFSCKLSVAKKSASLWALIVSKIVY